MSEENIMLVDQEELLRMTTDVVASYLSHNSMPADNVPDLIRSVHTAMKEVSGIELKQETKSKPAVSVAKSISDDYIVCLEDGKKLKMLKRYLRSQYNMSPDDYRRKWNLPSDYPMVAPAYSRKRSQFAKDIGLGRGKKEA
ncbi:MucR family transcriptional regulator [uncultured Maricaulis sp.]|uniref:MucR family transcriptional regulator n=1 Tax=uncultured Maricaulis sp. TaxID=174710 RepID=UPI0030D9F05D|tara:strand:- start:77956 stop:78378 length:423 start_codon:yes stop_codon:yes gene_type:complete